ncbi:hypothetical protein G4B88_006424 [Cannabis sativa]|uniref:Uncharacterized protein n=1 Tax=Cannabis sativa TaxID=3483 RepID=A0A7J6H2N9_CANSA|nr:hypothetical protein G4B88_006424 [Cannabis sativa]
MEVESPLSYGMDPSDDERADLSISELIGDLRTAFRPSDFDRVEEIFVIKENKMMEQIRDLESDKIRLEIEVKKLKTENSESRVLRENYEIMRERVKMAEEKAEKTEGMLERLLKDVKKNEREKLDEFDQLKEKIKVLESEKTRAEEDVQVWKKSFVELEKRVTLLEAELQNVVKIESLVPNVKAIDSTESDKANGEKGTGENDHHLPSPPTSPMNQDFLICTDNDDENAPPRTNLHDKGPIDLTYKGPIDLTYKDPIDLTDWDIKPILSKRKRSCSPNASGSKRKLDGATPTNDAKNRKSPSKHVQVEYEEKTREDKSSPTTFNQLTVGDESGAFNFEVSSSSDKQTSSSYHSDASVDLDEIFSQSQKPI